MNKETQDGAAAVPLQRDKHAQPLALVVDDDPLLVELMEIFLEQLGWQAQAALQGKQALALLGSQRFDLVLLDLQMPELDGINLLRWMRQEQGCDTPVVIVTGLVRPGLEAELRAQGASAVLSKPITLQTLEPIIRQIQGD